MSSSPLQTFDHASALEACARGDANALRDIYEHESRWLLGVAARITRDREAAQDIVQDAFLLIWQRAPSYRRALGSGRGWIYTVVRHRALDEARRRQVVFAAGDELERLSDAAGLHAHEATSDSTDSLDRCLHALDEHKRECIVAAFVDGYTHDQIAVKLAAPLGTVKAWIRRGLLQLKECLA